MTVKRVLRRAVGSSWVVAALVGLAGCDDDPNLAGPSFDLPDAAGPIPPATGTPDAATVRCGDGVVTAPETCDDGNTADSDGCSSTCTVESGYTCTGQPSTCGFVESCVPNPCQNGGTCTNGVNGFTCQCAPGYSGANCETNIDDCAPNPCQNGGTCIDGINASTCQCAPGFTGTHCETNIDDCSATPCRNGGTCVDGVNGFTCQCAPGYSGTTCATNINDCSPNPCQNGGTCADRVNGFTCFCAATYAGATCSTCAAGRANCNGLPADGCEAILESDANHCGACKTPCNAGQICSNGACRTPPPGPTAGTPIDIAAIHTPMAPAIADLNRDGKPDVLVANAESGSTVTPSGSVSVFLGNGDGTLKGEAYYTGAPLSSNAVVAADVDGDGWLDAITVNGQTNLSATNGSVSVHRNLGASAPGTFGSMQTFTTGTPGSVHLCAADLNGDGRVDIATTSVTSSQVSVLLNNGAGGFAVPVLTSIQNTGGVQSTIACRDLNGDGRVDLVVTSPSSARLSVLINQGNGSFAAPVAYPNSVNGQTAGLAFGDADGDGKLDILANGAAGAYIFFFKGNGDGTFANGVSSSTGQPATVNTALGVVAGDFNGDGKLDAYILRTATAGGVQPMTGSGTGTFTAGTIVLTGIQPALNALAAFDVTNDGYLDLILTNRTSSTLTVIPNGL